MERKTYTLTEIAQLLNRPRTTLSDWVDVFQDCIPAVKKGRTTRFPDEAIEVFRAIAEMRAEGKNLDAIRQALHAPVTDSKKESDGHAADTLLWTADLQGKIFQDVLQAQSEAAATHATNDAYVQPSSPELEPFSLRATVPEPDFFAFRQALDREPQPECKPNAIGVLSAEETASPNANSHAEAVALVPALPQEQHPEIQALQQALGEVRTEIATSTLSLLQQIATLNEQIRAQQFTIVSMQQSLERSRREQRSSFWKRLLVWQ